MNQTSQKNLNPEELTSLEYIAAEIGQKCYKDESLRSSMREDPLATICRLSKEKTDRTVDLDKLLPGLKIHPLENSSNRWHIVLPIDLTNASSDDDGFISDKELEDINAGAIFTTLATALGFTALSISVTTGFGSLAVSAVTGATVFTLGGFYATSYLIPQAVVAGTIASIIITGGALAVGVTAAAISGLAAGGIID